ncbi:hypothetical protein RYX36_023081 [Vicia faba]
MGVCDVVLRNLTLLYVVVTFCVKGYEVLNGGSYGGVFVVFVSTTLVALILVATLTWDLSRKFNKCTMFVVDQQHQSRTLSYCKGGICWHGVMDRSAAPQIRFKIPHHLPHVIL